MFACACGNNEWQWQSMHVNVGDNVSGVFNLLKPRQRERERVHGAWWEFCQDFLTESRVLI